MKITFDIDTAFIRHWADLLDSTKCLVKLIDETEELSINESDMDEVLKENAISYKNAIASIVISTLVHNKWKV